jgi:hypothetical protein
VISRDHFGFRGHYAHNYAVDARRLGARTEFVQTTRLPSGFGRERSKGAPPASTVEKYAPDATGRLGIVPPASRGVAVPRGSAHGPAQPGTAKRETGAANPEPRAPNPATSGANANDRAQRYAPAVPGVAPRQVDETPPAPAAAPAVPAATPVVPPVAKPVAAPPAPPPAKSAAPASGGVVRHSPASSPPPAAAPAGKAASAPAKRPR